MRQNQFRRKKFYVIVPVDDQSTSRPFEHNDSTITNLLECAEAVQVRQSEPRPATILGDHPILENRKLSRSTCQHCLKTFKYQSSMVMHLKMAHEELMKVFQCKDCNQSFESFESLLDHVISKHEETPLKCHLCPEHFLGQKGLNYHINTHAKGVQCLVCDMELTNQSALNFHMRKEHHEKPEKRRIAPGTNCIKLFCFNRRFHNLLQDYLL